MRKATADDVQDLQLANHSIRIAGHVGDVADLAMRRAEIDLVRKRQREKKQARKTRSLESLLSEPEAVPDFLQVLVAVDEVRVLLEQATMVEKALVGAYLQVWSLRKAAKESGVSLAAARQALKRLRARVATRK